ncbi:MAG: GAF domain-containing protein [Pseudomonadota bacterium]
MVEHPGNRLSVAERVAPTAAIAEGAQALDQHTRDVIVIMLDLVREQLDVPVAMVTLGKGHGARVVAARGEDDGEEIDPVLCRMCLESGGMLLLNDTLPLGPPVGEALSADKVRAYLGLPLVDAAGRPFGVVCAYGDEPRNWTKRDVDMLRGLAAVLDTEFRAAGLHARAA